MAIAHVIFDFDGVLIDSEQISMTIDRALLAENGINLLEEEMHRRFVGKTFDSMVAELEADHGLRLPADLSDRKDEEMLATYRRELTPIDGVLAMLEQLSLPCSIGTNGPRARALEALRLTGLDRFFGDRLTTFEDVRQGKPAPDIYLLAAKRASQPPAHCLVIEDSATGAIAALRAGCQVLGFIGAAHDPANRERDLRAAGVPDIIRHMSDLLPKISTSSQTIKREPLGF